MKQKMLLCITIGFLLAAAAGGCGAPDSGQNAGAAGGNAASDDASGTPADNGSPDDASLNDASGEQADDVSLNDGSVSQADGGAADVDAAETGALGDDTTSGTTFEATNMEGETVSSDIFPNSRLTMVNVWATYCGPCLGEMPELGELAAEYAPGDLQLIGIISDVTEDAKQKDLDYAADLIEETGADYPHLLLNESLYYGLLTDVSAVPTTFFFDENGVIIETVIGARDKTSWKEIIDALLEE